MTMQLNELSLAQLSVKLFWRDYKWETLCYVAGYCNSFLSVPLPENILWSILNFIPERFDIIPESIPRLISPRVSIIPLLTPIPRIAFYPYPIILDKYENVWEGCSHCYEYVCINTNGAYEGIQKVIYNKDDIILCNECYYRSDDNIGELCEGCGQEAYTGIMCDCY